MRLRPDERAALLELLRRDASREARDLDLRRQRTRESFRWFVEAAWPSVQPTRPFKPGRHIDVLCDFLQDYYDNGGGEDAVINIPPGTGKSLICSVLWPCWIWAAREPGHRSICTSYSATNARRDAIFARNFVQSEWWRQGWPRIGIPFQNTHAALDWTTSTGGWRISMPLGGQIIGRHGDAIVIDDPIKPEDARIERTALDEVQSIIDDTLTGRLLEPAKAHRLIVMQRLHQRDPSGVAIGRGARSLVLPMRFEAARADPRDWRTEEGELLWPAGRTEADVAKLEGPGGMTPYAVAGQLQQRPAPEGGGIFHVEWLQHRWKRLPDYGTWVQSWDCAFKGEESSDPVAGGVWCAHDGFFDLVHQVRGNLTFVETVQAICQTADDWPQASTVLVEDKANGSAVIDTLRRIRPGLDVIPVTPQGGKIARAHAATGHFHAGRVRVPIGDPWVEDWVSEHEVFPAGAHDDQVDQTTQALAHLSENDAGHYEDFVAALAAGIR